MSVLISTPGDTVALAIDSPSLSWMNLDLPNIINMAEPQPHESILILGCSTGELLIEVLKAPGVWNERMVSIDESRLAVQQAVRKLDDLDLLNDRKLICGDPYNLNTIHGLHEASQAHSHTTFDIIFTRNTLPSDASQHNSILRHWASFLTPTSGRMMITYCPCVGETPYLAGIQAMIGNGEVVTRIS